MSTPTPVPSQPAPTAAQTATTAVNSALVNQLLTMQQQLQGEIDYLGNAAALIADRQAKLTAVQTQLTALGYVAPSS